MKLRGVRALKIQDDIIVGGNTQLEAATNYIMILEKLFLANLRVEPTKTLVFPKTAHIAGYGEKADSSQSPLTGEALC